MQAASLPCTLPMTTDQKSDTAAAEVLAHAGARPCQRCGTESLIPVHEDGHQLWFCFECGYDEKPVKDAKDD